jgi:hypothetical protein
MNNATSEVGVVNVFTADHRGHTPEELAHLALDKILYVGEKSHPAIIEQAKAFKEQIRSVLVHYLNAAQEAERTTIAAKLTRHGYDDLAKLIRSI